MASGGKDRSWRSMSRLSMIGGSDDAQFMRMQRALGTSRKEELSGYFQRYFQLSWDRNLLLNTKESPSAYLLIILSYV